MVSPPSFAGPARADDRVVAGVEDALAAIVPANSEVFVTWLAEHLEDFTEPLCLSQAMPVDHHDVAGRRPRSLAFCTHGCLLDGGGTIVALTARPVIMATTDRSSSMRPPLP